MLGRIDFKPAMEVFIGLTVIMSLAVLFGVAAAILAQRGL